MKIVVNSRMYQNTETGIPHYIRSLYSELVKNPDRKYIFLQSNGRKTLGETRIFTTPKNILGNILFDVYLVHRLISRIPDIDVFHAPANILPWMKMKNVQYVVSIMDLSFITVPKLSGWIFNMYYRILVGRSLKMADAVIAISESTKRDIIKVYKTPPEKIYVTYPGIDEIFFNSKLTKRAISKPYFFSLTTHPKRKNIYAILRAMKQSTELKDHIFVLAGLIEPGPLAELVSYIKSNGLSKRVKLLGFVSTEKLISLYQHAEFFIYPSYYEGFGFPPIEAMACRCPVIVSNTSSLPEVVPDTRWHIDPYDVTSIAQTMDKLVLLSKRERVDLIKNNFEYVKKFRWTKTAQQTLKIFDRITS